jgi:signal transduction histidine kinase
VRNPLAGMRGALEILRRDATLKPETDEVLVELMAQIDRMEGLVRDLLDYASPRPLVLRGFDLQELLGRLLRAYKDQADLAGVTVQSIHAPGTSWIVADPQQMEQVFLNLLHNALQAMEAGGTLTVRTDRSEEDTVVTFQDTGKGITEDVLPQIFQPFFTTKHRGSGLGLSIVRKIVEGHGGTIEVQSTVGRGTTATVRVPRRRSC